MNNELNVIKAQRGDRHAFVSLMRMIESDLYGMAYSMLRQVEDCADVMQESMLSAYKSIHQLRDPAYFKTWIFRILINECNKVLRNRTSTYAAMRLSDIATTSGGYDQIELHEAVQGLEESMRTTIILYYFQDMSIKEIASILDISESAVKTRLHRARKILLLQLQTEQEKEMIIRENY
ncbi:RNA polymerase sigma factor [Paenibacillus pini]|uniref:RNA polymerase n=1 Tax=Paenibacillus pini JCM 16418 TaxID=1236976 RepID=W7Z281_9BACL|nr:sigma-70 family RNA polymerase sigma factor [Paenibacillus pini]GAF08519.1 RNA polymerase [Paenibacillus pini JCM 16418]